MTGWIRFEERREVCCTESRSSVEKRKQDLQILANQAAELMTDTHDLNFSAAARVQKTAPLNFCTPPDLHSALHKSNGESVGDFRKRIYRRFDSFPKVVKSAL